MRYSVAVVVRNGPEDPKIQIWREDSTLPGVYYKPYNDIPIINIKGLCTVDRSIGVLRCTLSDSERVSVQPGDILGLELPQEGNDSLEIQFKSGEQDNYVFQGKLPSTANLSEASNITRDLPQITLLVALGKLTVKTYFLFKQCCSLLLCLLNNIEENADSCPDNSSDTLPQTPSIPACFSDATHADVTTTRMATDPTTVVRTKFSLVLQGSISTLIVATLIAIIIVILVIVYVRRIKRKEYHGALIQGINHPNAVHNGKGEHHLYTGGKYSVSNNNNHLL